MPARVSRRVFLGTSAAAVGGLVGTVVAAMVAGCTAGESRSSKASADRPVVVVGNHPLYIDAATNPAFEAATGTQVEYHEDITDDAAWLASVTSELARGASIDRDVVIVGDWVGDRLDRSGRVARQVTWALNMVGIAYDHRKVPTEVTRIAQLFQPPLHGLVALPTDMRVALGMALLADGTDPSTVSHDAATVTATRLANSVKLRQILPFDRSRPIDHLVAGEVLAAVVVASDTIGLEHDHPDIRFVVPDEGGLLLTDVAVLLGSAQNPDGGRRYLDYVDDPTHAAARFRVVPTLWTPGPVDAVLASTARDVVADARRNPAPEVRARLRPFRFLDENEDRMFTALFDGVIHATR